MKITKAELKKIIREELANANPRMLTEGWSGWNLNEFEAFIKDHYVLVNRGLPIVRKTVDGMIQGVKKMISKPHWHQDEFDIIRKKAFNVIRQLSTEHRAMTKRYEISGDSLYDFTDPWTAILTYEDKLKPVATTDPYTEYGTFVDLLDCMHPSFNKKRLTSLSLRRDKKYASSIYAAAQKGNQELAGKLFIKAAIDAYKNWTAVLPEHTKRAMESMMDQEVGPDAWASEVVALEIAMQEDEVSATKLMASSKFASELQDAKEDDYDVRWGNTPKGFLPSHRIFAKGVKQGPRN